jgi:hypothetical protein
MGEDEVADKTPSYAVTNVLMNEYIRRPAHKLHYIDWALSAIDVQLRIFNQQLKKPRQRSNV